ncbi:MAG: hypothetical protein KC912_09340 [Proteobacteria bacterium]|nr:hypothetical protein [Pseudomonadota bacterium]
MFKAVVVVIVAMTLLGMARQGFGWWRRERVMRSLDTDALLRSTRSVTVRVLVTGVKSWRGLDARRRTGVRADLVLTDERFLVISDRGVLLDATAETSPLQSARCTGPGRLVLEGSVGRADGMFRLEMVLDDAQGWAADLREFVSAEGGQRFTSFEAKPAS